MPFKSITTFSDDPLVKLAREYEYFQRRDKRMAELEQLRRQQLYGLELPSGLGIDSDKVPDSYEVSALDRLNQAKVAQRTRKNRLQAPLDDVSMDMLSHPDEYLLRDPAKRAQMARDVGGKMSGALSLMSLPMSFVAPAAMGTGLLAKGLTGAGLNVALSAPSYMHDPDTAEPLLDALMGAGAGVAGLPGAIVGGLMGWSPDIEAGYAGGGAVKSLGKRMSKYFAEDPEHLSKVQEIIKETGGNWLGGRVEKSLATLKGGPVDDGTELIRRGLLDPEDAAKDPNIALNKWISGPLTKYVKRDLATPKDPVRALAEQGILHYAPELEVSPYLTQMRANQGFPAQGVGKSQLASAWEAMSDRGIHSGRARSYQNDIRDLNENPWLDKLSPNDPVYFPIGGSSFPVNLGLDHLTDELLNALNPGSGLPRELLLNPADMKQMGIDRAVRHVDKINKYRAKEMERAALADMAGMPVVKEYPEGFKWVELKKPENTDTSGYSVRKSKRQPPVGEPMWELVDPSGNVVSTVSGDEEFAKQMIGDHLSSSQLEKWLKQEGDIMGHCVGGYCEDVIEGRSRIFSLRDSKGQPHVTVEVSPGSYSATDPDNFMVQDWLMNRSHQYEEEYGEGAMDAAMEDFIKEQPFAEMADRVVQIKGKQNQAPKPEYLPFVQDFVKNQGPWSDVGDLRNTGLYHRSHLTPEEQKLLISGEDYLTMDEIKKLREGKPWTSIDTDPDFAVGGQVKSPEVLKIIAEFGGKYAAS